MAIDAMLKEIERAVGTQPAFMHHKNNKIALEAVPTLCRLLRIYEKWAKDEMPSIGHTRMHDELASAIEEGR